MELWGVEPQASWMQIKRSTNWAKAPLALLVQSTLELGYARRSLKGEGGLVSGEILLIIFM